MEAERPQWVPTSYSNERGGLKLGRISGSIQILVLSASVLAGFVAIAALMAIGISILLSLVLAVQIPASVYLFLIWLSARPEGYLEDWLESLFIRYSKHELFNDEDLNETFQ